MKNGKYTKRSGVATKTLVLALAVMLIVGCTIGGTIAFLTANTTEVTNTFSVGDITMTIAETTRTYKIVPGGKDAKDPTITVESSSEKCYVYACVDNGVELDGVAVATPNIDTTKWVKVASDGNKVLYRYYQIVDASTADVALAVFTEVEYSASITKDDLEDLDNTTIVIQGFAHQSDNTTQTVADAAATEFFGLDD